MEVSQCPNTDVMKDGISFGSLTITPGLANSIAALFEDSVYECDVMESSVERLIIGFYSKGFELIITPASDYRFAIKIVCVACNEDEDEDEMLENLSLALKIRRMFIVAEYKALNVDTSTTYSLEKLVCGLNVKKLLDTVSLAGQLIHLTPEDFFPMRKCGLPPNPDTLN